MEAADRRFFAFKGLFSEEYLSRLASGHSLLACYFGSAGKNRNLPSATRFSATKPQVSGAQNRGLAGNALIFSALPELPDGSMRQIPESPNTPPFLGKEAAGSSVVAIQCGRHVWNLPHTSGFSTSRLGCLSIWSCGI